MVLCLQARQKFSHSEIEFSELIYEKADNDINLGLIRSKGDTALLGENTTQIKYHKSIYCIIARKCKEKCRVN